MEQTISQFWNLFEEKLAEAIGYTPMAYGILPAETVSIADLAHTIRTKLQTAAASPHGLDKINLGTITFRRTFAAFRPGQNFSQMKLRAVRGITTERGGSAVKRQKQGYNECVLAALCNATDTDIKLARSLFPNNWKSWNTLRQRDPHTALALLLAIAPKANPVNLRKSLAGCFGDSVPDATPFSVEQVELLATTKGIFALRFSDGTGHALAYDHGLIVDSNHPARGDYQDSQP